MTEGRKNGRGEKKEGKEGRWHDKNEKKERVARGNSDVKHGDVGTYSDVGMVT
jgi:hypothetical protein